MNEYYGGSSNQGRLWLLDSSATMTETDIEDASVLVLEGDEALNSDSTAASFLGGDFDGDGFSDLVVTQSAYADPSTGEFLGRVFVVMAPGS